MIHLRLYFLKITSICRGKSISHVMSTNLARILYEIKAAVSYQIHKTIPNPLFLYNFCHSFYLTRLLKAWNCIMLSTKAFITTIFKSSVRYRTQRGSINLFNKWIHSIASLVFLFKYYNWLSKVILKSKPVFFNFPEFIRCNSIYADWKGDLLAYAISCKATQFIKKDGYLQRDAICLHFLGASSMFCSRKVYKSWKIVGSLSGHIKNYLNVIHGV